MSRLRSLLIVRLLALVGLFVAPTLTAVPQADSSGELPYPTSYVMDFAHVLPSGADERLTLRLKQFYFGSNEKISLHVYTLRSARQGSPESVEQDLLRQWRANSYSKDIADEVAVIFVFADEKEARVFVGNNAPAELKAAVQDLVPQRIDDLTRDTEPVLTPLIDRIAANLGVPSTYHDLPAVEALPPGASIVGKAVEGSPMQTGNCISDVDRAEIAKVIEGASHHAGHPIVLVLNPERGLFKSEDIAANLEAARPDTTQLILFQKSGEAFLRPASSYKGLFSKEIERIEGELTEAMRAEKNSSQGRLGRALKRILKEIGDIAEGHPPPPFDLQMHPLLMLAGGQDNEWQDGIIPALFALAALILAGFWFSYFLKHPGEALVGLVFLVVDGVISGGGGGGGGSGGGSSGFSGGGGSSGGGGASGSW